MIVTVIVLALFLELLLRKYFPQPDLCQREKRKSGYIPKSPPPNQVVTIKTKRDVYTHLPLQDWLITTSKTNNVGFVGRDIPAIKRENECRVFILCGSQLHGMMLPDDKKFMALCSKEHMDCNIFAVPQIACSTADTVAMLCHKVIQYEPDIVLVNVGITQQRVPTENYKHSSLSVPSTLSLFLFFLTQFALFNWVVKYFTYLKEKMWVAHNGGMETIILYPKKITPFSQCDSKFQPVPDEARFYRTLLCTLVGACRENDIKIGFILQPHAFVDPFLPYMKISKVPYKREEMVKLLRFYEDVILDVSLAKKIPTLKFSEQELPRNGECFSDVVHLTPKGMKIVTSNIVAFIKELQAIKSL